ncbi:hypothetical protein BC832DRAFT_525888, partial [Gaertneriomyces semiglobifer]
CEFYAAGGCKMGEHCPFSHAGPGATFEERKPCRFFKSGSCVRGAHCPWSHDMKIEPCVFFHFKSGCVKGDDCPFSHAEITEEQRQVLEHEQQSHVPCYFYHLGRGCINGDKCPHSHEKLSAEEMERFLES